MPDNRAPTAIRLNAAAVAEAQAGAVVGRLRVTDPDPGETFTFAVDDDRFFVNANGRLKLRRNVELDREEAATVTVEVTATDAGGLSVTQAFTLDVLDRQPAIDLVSLDGPLLDDRLVFTHLEDTDGREDKSVATLRIVNRGEDSLRLADLVLDGPFVLVDPGQDAPTTLAAGGFLDIAVRFDRDLYEPATDPDLFGGTLTVVSDDPATPTIAVDLAGFWQAQPEKGQEPTINEVWALFGYGNSVVPVSALDNFDFVEQVNAQEVLAPYWQLAPGVDAATITWIGSWHGFKAPASIALHAPGDVTQSVTLLTQAENQNQTALPVTDDGKVSIATIDDVLVPNAWDGDQVFGLFIQGESSDPTLNAPGADIPPENPDAPRGHFVRVFQALDGDGVAIPNTWLVIQDYNSRSLNYDYNDNMFLLTGLVPADDPFGP